MAERFKGRAAIVTGGASGIGAGIVQRLRAEGASVSLWDMQPGELADSGAVHGVALDVTDADGFGQGIDAAQHPRARVGTKTNVFGCHFENPL